MLILEYSSGSSCHSTCSGNDNEICGGPGALSLYRNPSKAVNSVKLPAGWSAAGCIVDGVNNGRTLSGYSFSSSNMTQNLCVNTCNDRKFTYAGVEYGRECYCSNSPTVSKTASNVRQMVLTYQQTLQTSTNCNMGCSGDARYTCGGREWLYAATQGLHMANIPVF